MQAVCRLQDKVVGLETSPPESVEELAKATHRLLQTAYGLIAQAVDLNGVTVSPHLTALLQAFHSLCVRIQEAKRTTALATLCVEVASLFR